MQLVVPHITVRKPTFDFSSVPRNWFYGSYLTSHTADALHLLFPAGERFFIRSVLHYLPRITDPTLRARVKAFAAQEASHGRSHEASFSHLEAHGFEYASFLRVYEKVVFGFVERIGPRKLRLSVTVALEHFTATMAVHALTEGHLQNTHPTMGRMLLWHACEEIEHRSVAFEVYRAVGGSYPTRIAGLAVALGGLLVVWAAAARHLIKQEPALTPARRKQEAREAAARQQDRRFLREAIRTYLHPDFHPDALPGADLAQAWLAENGFSAPEPT